jgi:DNA-binding NarL/FixJ family response regulator
MTNHERIDLALVEDDRPFRGYVVALLNSERTWRVVLEADSVEEALRIGGKLRPRVLLLDVGLPGKSGADAVGDFLKLWPEVSVVMLTAVADDEVVLEAIRAGACGYVLKGASSDALIAAIKDALAGGAPMSPSIARRVLSLLRTLPPATVESEELTRPGKGREASAERLPVLTPRELEVVSLVAEGLGDKEIAERLGTALSTVKNHLAAVYAKWRVRSRTEAAIKFTQAGR